jgi:hypothetical protein
MNIFQDCLLIVMKISEIRRDGHTCVVKAGDDQDMSMGYKCAQLFSQEIILLLLSWYHPVVMATTRSVSLKLMFMSTPHYIRISVFLIFCQSFTTLTL